MAEALQVKSALAMALEELAKRFTAVKRIKRIKTADRKPVRRIFEL
ncbi:MAG: hypothetical protein IJY65_01870 [Clostridia bacterium]|nr:hypothetical protein [Clostridia bacterium]